MKSFVIIGGGASGVVLAAQLLRLSPDANVRIFDRSGAVGAGIAYSTRNPSHLLNVRAGNMSAFPEEPEHFLHWLRARDPGEDWQAASFAPRMLYRAYLQDLLPSGVTVDADEVVDVALDAGRPVVTTTGGASHRADAAILATGNEAAIAVSGARVAEYWSSNGYFDIPADAPVAIFGTGLSMVDSVLSLLDNGHRGEIHAISRRGLVPARHAPAEPFAVDTAALPVADGLSVLTKELRALARQADTAGTNWRAVMEALRPCTKAIWAQLSLAERRRFLRHLRPWWDIHRHRMAPAVADRIDAARRSGQLQVAAGRLLTVREGADGMTVQYRPRHTRTVRTLNVAAIIDCRGGNPRFSRTRNPALIGLMEHGLARPDALDLGLDVTGDLQLLDAHGAPSGPLFALGPATKGVFWEVTAVPDIRVQAEALARRLTQD